MNKILSLFLLLISVQSKAQLSATHFYANPLCYGDSTGSITVSVNGGVTPYNYLWNTSQTTFGIINLPDGIYICVITDATSDTISDTITLMQPTLLTLSSIITTPPTCGTCCDGVVALTPFGGVTPYTVSPDPFQLCPGNYIFCATDANGCNSCDSVSVSFANEISLLKNDFDLNLFLNPTTDEFSIKIPIRNSVKKIEIADAIGKIVFVDTRNLNSVIINLKSFSPGVYFVKVEMIDGNFQVKKFLKN